MKNYHCNFLNIFGLSILFCLGGLGSIIFGFYPQWGGFFIFCGVIGSIYSLISTELNNRNLYNLLEIQATMMASKGIGNVYLEHVHRELRRKGFCETTVEFLLKALELNPDDIEALEILSAGLTLQLSFEAAVGDIKDIVKTHIIHDIRRLIKKALKSTPKNASFYIDLGILRDLEGKHGKARYWFKRSAKFRTDPYWRLGMSTSWGMSKDYQKALEQVEAAIQEGAKGWITDFYYGRTLVSVGQYEKAVFYLEKAYRNKPYRPEILKFYEDAYYMQGFFIKSAFLKLRLSILLFFLNPKKSLRYLFEAIITCGLALAFRISKSMWVVIKHLPWLAKIQLMIVPPDEPEKSLAAMMIAKKHFDMAVQLYKKAIAIYPKRIESLINLATCLIRLDNRKEEAIEILDKALLIAPNDKFIKEYKSAIEKGYIDKTKEGRTIWLDHRQNIIKIEQENQSQVSPYGCG